MRKIQKIKKTRNIRKTRNPRKTRRIKKGRRVVQRGGDIETITGSNYLTFIDFFNAVDKAGQDRMKLYLDGSEGSSLPIYQIQYEDNYDVTTVDNAIMINKILNEIGTKQNEYKKYVIMIN